MEPAKSQISESLDTYRVRYGLKDHVAGLPVLEEETVQLGTGRGRFASRLTLGRDLVIFESRVAPKMIGHIVVDPAWVVFMLPLRWRGDYLFKGLAASPHDVFINCDPSGYTTTGEERYTLAIGIRKSQLAKAMRALTGGAELPPMHDQRLVLGGGQSLALRRRALAATKSALSLPLGKGRFVLPRAEERDIISLLSAVMLSQPAYCPSRDPGRIQPFKIVRAAEYAYEAQLGENVSLADLCEASGVGQTWLSKCFRDVYGVSPAAYLRARRLTEARLRLLDRSAPPVSVKDVALSLGFVHLGRFAADYRERFKEKPSDSLLPTARS